MNLTELCVKKPVFATMLILTLVVLGLASYSQLGIDLFPKVDIPTVSVMTVLEGASPEEVETQVTKPLEEALNTIEGVDDMGSTTMEGLSVINVSFVLEKNLDEAVNDVRQKVSANLDLLPDDVKNPVIEKFDPDASPIIGIVVSGKRSDREITEIADKKIKRQLQTVRNVGSVTLVGDRKREIQVFIDPNKLFTYNLSIDDVKNSIKAQNVEIPGGRLTWNYYEKGLRTMGRIDKVSEFDNLIVANFKGAPVHLKDIGYVVDGTEEARSLSRLNGKNAVTLLIRKQSGSNTIEVVNGVLKKISDLKKILPEDIKLSTVMDQSRFIRKSIAEVEHHMILGAIFASLVVLLFIRNIRAALISAITIPVSIIATFVMMKYMGFTLNNLTLLALSLCTGIIIDDAIIVLENIFRYVEEKGYSPFEAAIAGTKEIFGAVLATTVSLIVIFVPVAFMKGTVGRFFYSFGLTATFAIATSFFVALTLVPTLTARILKKTDPSLHEAESKESLMFKIINSNYDKALKWSLNHRIIMVIIAVLIVASTPFLFKHVKNEFFPKDDMSQYQIVIQTPPGSSLDESDRILKSIEEKVQKLPGVKDVFATIGSTGGTSSNVTNASIFVNLIPIQERKESQEDIMQLSRDILKNYPGLRTSVQNLGAISGGGFRQTEFNMVVQGPEMSKLELYSKQIINELSKYPGFVDLDTAQEKVSPEAKLKIDRDKSSDLGINILSIASALRTMIGGEDVSKYREGVEQYDIRLRLDPEFRQNSSNVLQLPIRDGNGQLLRLENIAKITEGKSASQIDHFNQQRQITIIANLKIPLGDAIKIGNEVVKNVNLPPQYSTTFTGKGKLLKEANEGFIVAALLSIVFIYIVLAAQFNRFLQPLIIMASIPLSVPFGLLSLLVFNQTLNIDSMIGILLLFGIVKKNAILQVDYTNTLVETGMPTEKAIIEADHARLRPILMTTLAIMAGMLPIALGKGDGSAPRATMATLIIGGQALSLFITLLITPVLYSLFSEIKGKYFTKNKNEQDINNNNDPKDFDKQSYGSLIIKDVIPKSSNNNDVVIASSGGDKNPIKDKLNLNQETENE